MEVSAMLLFPVPFSCHNAIEHANERHDDRIQAKPEDSSNHSHQFKRRMNALTRLRERGFSKHPSPSLDPAAFVL